MKKKIVWAWIGGTAAVLALGSAGAVAVALDPFLLPGSHEVEVYALDDDVTQEVSEAPGGLGGALGMCDADSYYAEDGTRKLCLVLSGPLGTVQARQDAGTITVDAAGTASLKSMAGLETGATHPTTTLVLMAGKPVALLPVPGPAAAGQVSARELT